MMNDQKDTNGQKIYQNPDSIARETTVLKGNKITGLHKRTERLVAAIYLVSELLSESNPLKIRLRQSGVDILSYMLSPNIFFAADSESFSAQYSIRLMEILSYLDVANLSGFVSAMNHRILLQEMDKIIDIAENMKKEPISTLSLSKEFFMTEKRKESDKLLPNPLISSDGRKHRLLKMMSREADHKGHYKRHDLIGHMSFKTASGQGYNSLGQDRRRSLYGKDSRRKQILEMLKDGNFLTIKDFSLIIKDCSEKTIQRELLALVGENVLKKEGERRWSKYSLRTAA